MQLISIRALFKHLFMYLVVAIIASCPRWEGAGNIGFDNHGVKLAWQEGDFLPFVLRILLILSNAWHHYLISYAC